MVYFDNGATTFPKPQQVYDKVLQVMTEYGANPGRSGHRMALKASRGIYDTRELIAKLFNIDNPMNLLFCSNATEALNIGIKGVLDSGDHVITTSMEHNSVLRPIKYLENYGIEATIVRADHQGHIRVEDIERQIKKNTKLIVNTHISNLTGTIMPLGDIGRLTKARGLIYMVDAAQSAGVYNVDVEAMNIDLLAFPGHKGLLGPQGTGGLYIRDGLAIKEFMHGGTGSASNSLIQPTIMPDRFESGTGNAPGIIALGEGIRYILDKGMDEIRRHEEELTEHFIMEALQIEGVQLYGPLNVKEQAAVVALNIKGLDSSEASYILDQEYDIAVRPGLHCAPLAHETIGTLSQGAVRFSFGVFNTHEEIDYAIKALKEIAKGV